MKRLLAGCWIVLLVGCADEGQGTLRLVVSGGNEAATMEIGADAFVDGYAIRLDAAVLSITALSLRTSTGDDARVNVDPLLVDIVPRSVRVLELEALPAQRWDAVSWVNGPPSDASEPVNVAPAIVRRMIEGGYSFYFEGVIVPPAGTFDSEGRELSEIPFEVGFPVTSRYFDCISGVDRKPGVAVPPNGVAEAEISWHLTHAFFDSYAENAALRAAPWAGAWKGAGPLTIDDLDAQPLTLLRGPDGVPLEDEVGGPVIYVAGSTGATTLREFVLAARFGHFDGLAGECVTEIVSHAE